MAKELYNIPHYHDFKEMVLSVAQKHPHEIAYRYFKGNEIVEIDFAKAKHDFFAMASYFASIGLHSEKIALYAENSYEWIVIYIGAVLSKNIIVPLDKELKPQEAAKLYDACGAKMLVYSSKKSELAEILAEKLPHSLCLDNFSAAVEKGHTLLTETGVLDFEADLDALCTMIFTSGTTGTPKCVMLCQRNLLADMINSMESMYFAKGTVCVLPLNHTFGMMACILTQFYIGFPVFLNSGLKYVLRDIKAAKPGHISVVPLFVENFYKNIWKNARKSGKEQTLKNTIKFSNALRKIGIDLRRTLFKSVIDGFGGNIEMIITGGAPVSNELIKGFDDFGIILVNGYGITECSPIVSFTPLENSKAGSIGKPIKNTEVKIINPNSDGEGELCVKGDIVMMGYYNNPEANEKVFQDGWFLTGDIGKIDKDGFIFLTGRKKNMILLDNGKNVYPEELEELIGRIDGVTEVLVYAKDGLITAEIFAENPENRAEIESKIKNELNKTIAGYKQIRSVIFRDGEFEKTTTKKIKR